MVTCSVCGAIKETKVGKKGPRCPKGWKRKNDDFYCSKCWHSRYILRAVTIPIAGPISCDWSELWTALGKMWAQSTQIANWAVRKLAETDVVRGPDAEKMPKRTYPYLYPEARKLRPEVPSTSVASILQSVNQKYRKRRFHMWGTKESIPTFRDLPFPVHNQNWKIKKTDDGEYHLSFPAPRPGPKITVRLKGGKGQKRQLRSVDKLLAGDAVQGELALIKRRASSGDHRPTTVLRTPKGGQKIRYSVDVKLVMWLPRYEKTKSVRDKKLLLRTDADAFLVGEVGMSPPWVLNADHIKRWVAEHSRRLHRFSEDMKYEKRLPKTKRLQMNENRELFVDKHHRRIKTWNQQAAVSVAKYAKRHNVSEVIFDHSNRDYLESYGWYAFCTALSNKLDEFGILFDVASDDVVEEKQESLEVE